MRILFLTHYFPPEVNAPATRTWDHTVRWAAAGHDVTVLTCAPNCPDGVVFPGYRNRFGIQKEEVRGVRVVRVWTYLSPNSGAVRRIVNYLSYWLSAVVASFWLPRPDVVVATSPQFFCGWAGVVVARLKRAPLVLEIRDLWPESIVAVGAMRNRAMLRILEALERHMYLAADRIVAVGEGYRRKILEKVRPRKPIEVITNGVDLGQFDPRLRDEEFLARWDLAGRFVCSYVGTIGMAHGLEVVIEAAGILKSRGRDGIRFCLVGDGAARADLERRAREVGVADRVVFTGRLAKEKIPAVLASSDACLIHLKKCELFGTVLPSKVFETMAMGRPIIMGVRGEACRIVLDAEAGVAMEPDSALSLVEVVERLADDREFTARLGRCARDVVARNYNRDVLAARFVRLLAEVVAGRRSQ